MKIRLEYNEYIGWLHFSNILDPTHERDSYKTLLKSINIEYAIAFQDFIKEKVPSCNSVFYCKEKPKDKLSFLKMKKYLEDFLKERKIHDR